MAEAIWNARTRAHVQHFASYLKPFQRAAATRLFDDAEVALETVQAWILTLRDVPPDVLEEARERVLAEGITWMPKPGDVKRHCAAIVDERRKSYLQRAAEVIASCERCLGTTFTTVEISGVEYSTRCTCHTAAMAIEAEAPRALPLPKPRDDDHDAA